ncbi:ABC transporter permease [Lactobacillus sp. UCMA15818]|uniref:ABC transporter permease n=1 Tax=Lactobacillus sp. UCMA15818 TaxID=2583394 RepID=UPI0025B002BA|nr:ABC transporter permease [Lactobacillus sp. UCMA15818]
MTQYTQTFTLLKANLKRDWLKMTIWLIVLVGMFVAVAAKFKSIYGTTKQVSAIAQTLKSQAMVSLFGPLTTNHLNTAIIFAVEMMVFWGIFIVIFNFSLSVGITRGQEESGLTEMVLGGHPVGRLAPLAAACLELVIANSVFVIATGAGMMAANMPESDENGNWLFAITLGAVGLSFGLISLIFAQLVADSHNVTIYNYAFFGITYLVRMMTDVSNPDYTWLSPFGWIEKADIYTKNNWLPVILLLGLGIIGFAVAVLLNGNRDIDSGIIQVRGGKRTSRFLRGSGTLLFWNQKTSSLFWIIGMAVLGASYGSVFNSISKIANDSPVVRQVLGQNGMRHLEQNQILSFVSILGVIFSVLAVVGGAMVTSHLYTEERQGYLQIISTKPQSRSKLLAAYMAYGFVLSVIILFAALIATMEAGNSVLRQPLAFKYFWQIFIAMLPILALFTGILVALIGFVPKWRAAVWVALGGSFVISYFGRLIDLPAWAMKLSPFYWFRKVPLEHIDVVPVTWMTGIALVMLVLGFVGYNRRDIES